MTVSAVSIDRVNAELRDSFLAQRMFSSRGNYGVIDTPLERVLKDFEDIEDSDMVVQSLHLAERPLYADLGCGSGRALLELQRQVGGVGMGFDASLEHLRNSGFPGLYADYVLNAIRSPDNVVFFSHDVHRVSEKLKDADLIFSRFTLQYCMLPLLVLDEACKSVAPDGRLLLADFPEHAVAYTRDNTKLLLPQVCEELTSLNPSWTFHYADGQRIKQRSRIVVTAGDNAYESPFSIGERHKRLVSVFDANVVLPSTDSKRFKHEYRPRTD